MQLRSRRSQPDPEPLWRRIERAAGEMNLYLLLFAVGLVVLYLTCIVMFLIKLPITRVSGTAPASVGIIAERLAPGEAGRPPAGALQPSPHRWRIHV